MAVITPVGMVDFDWSPREQKEEQIVKTASASKASAGESKTVVAAKTDKDMLYEVAKKVIQAQFDETEAEDEDKEDSGDEIDKGEDVIEDVSDEDSEVEIEVEDVEAIGDVQEAVAELVEKSEQADEVAEKVSAAVEAVESAVEGVKAAIGGVGDEVELAIEGPVDDEVELEIEVVDDDMGGDMEEVDMSECCEEGGEDIIQESVEGCGSFAKAKKALQKEAVADEFQKISKISPMTKKKITDYWKKQLNYVPDYVALMTTNYEK